MLVCTALHTCTCTNVYSCPSHWILLLSPLPVFAMIGHPSINMPIVVKSLQLAAYVDGRTNVIAFQKPGKLSNSYRLLKDVSAQPRHI